MRAESGIETWRMFIALPVPDAVKGELGALQHELSEGLREGSVRWTRPEQMHLTLRFLGDVPAVQVEELEREVRKVCAGVVPIQLNAERVGFFPHARRPRVIWASVQDEGGQLASLQLAVSKATNGLIPLLDEEADFRGHLTVGRIRRINSHEARVLAKIAEHSSERCFGAWMASTVEIVRSELASEGSRHTCVASITLLSQEMQGRQGG